MLERLSGSLCDAVLDRTGSAAILHELDRADVFVVPLDNRHEWYRCHRLFRDALRLELDATEPGGVTRTLLRAADWFESHQRIDKQFDSTWLRVTTRGDCIIERSTEAGSSRADCRRRTCSW